MTFQPDPPAVRWLTVPFLLEAHVDFGVGLGIYDQSRTWRHGYADQ